MYQYVFVVHVLIRKKRFPEIKKVVFVERPGVMVE